MLIFDDLPSIRDFNKYESLIYLANAEWINVEVNELCEYLYLERAVIQGYVLHIGPFSLNTLIRGSYLD